MLNLGFKKSPHEPCIYSKGVTSNVTFVALYVDGFLIFWKNKSDSDDLKRAISFNFKVKDCIKQYLGIRFRKLKML